MAKHASLVFGGVPVLYTPRANFPISGSHRKSGLLVPTIATGSDAAFELSRPTTSTLRRIWMPTSARASSANAVCNWAAKCVICNRITAAVDGDWMPNDQKSVHNNRYQFQMETSSSS